jgi:hypothetical protein
VAQPLLAAATLRSLAGTAITLPVPVRYHLTLHLGGFNNKLPIMTLVRHAAAYLTGAQTSMHIPPVSLKGVLL